jgi:S-adenosylmethionine hydrolase
MAKPIIAFLTDFGTRDHYTGVLKGVVLGIAPDATLVDLSHDLPAHDVPFAARELAATYKYYPGGTIFVVVIDPGVGTARRGIAAEVGEWKFVAPDNGVLTGVFHEAPPKKVVELTERRYARPTVSRTFEGRDRFAPAAAFLAKGIQLAALGRAITDYQMLDLPQPHQEGDVLKGEVVRIDHFGNVVTNLDRKACEKLMNGSASLRLTIGGRSIARLVSTFSDIAAGEIAALYGSTDHLECAAHAESAAARLGVTVGDPVELGRQ